MQYSYYDSPIGRLLLAGEFGILQQIKFNYQAGTLPGEYNPNFFNEIKKQLTEFFLCKRFSFNVEYQLRVTQFQRKVLQQVAQIPFGNTTTYSAIAQQIGKINAARAVGAAVHHNPLPILIPCHRIIGKNGKLTGFAAGIDTKKKLLDIEQIALNHNACTYT